LHSSTQYCLTFAEDRAWVSMPLAL
jgi:hypothetical protein